MRRARHTTDRRRVPRAPQDEPLLESHGDDAADHGGGLIAGLRDEGNRLAATRGVLIGTVLGVVLWAAILWGLF